MARRYYIGTYSRPILFGDGTVLEGRGVGIHTVELDGGALRPVCPPVPEENPSFLTLSPDGRFLYAACECKTFAGQPGGAVAAYAVSPEGGLRLLNREPAHGEDPCHAAVSPDGRWLAAANFSGGSVTLFPINRDGSLAPASQVLRHTGRSVHPQMQAAPHPHMVRFQDGRALVSDLGIDRLVPYRLADGALSPDGMPYCAPPGAGPRHFTFGPGRIYIVHELEGAVAVLDSALQTLQRVPAVPPEYRGRSTCADLHRTPDGRFLFVSVRAMDTLAAFPIGPDGLLGAPRHFPCGGKTPRNFAIDPSGRWLLCANQDSGTLTLFSLSDGALTPAGQLEIPNPVCVRAANAVE